MDSNTTAKSFSRKHFIITVAITAALCLGIGLSAGALLWHKDSKESANVNSETTAESEESKVTEEAEESEIPVPQMAGVAAPVAAPDNAVILDIHGMTSAYGTLQAAIDAAGTNEATLRLNQNIEEVFEIAEGQIITFDFGDYEHTGIVTNRGKLTILSGTVGTVCNEGEKASIFISGGKIESVSGFYEDITLEGGFYGMEFNYHWVSEGYVMKDNPYPDTKEKYPYMVDYDCACIIETDTGIKTYQTVCEAVNDTGNTPATIELRRDHLEENAIEIKEGQNITLNCSYYTLTTLGITEVSGYFTFDGGTLAGEIAVNDGLTHIISGEIIKENSRVVNVYGGELLVTGGTINGWTCILIEEEAESVTISGGEINGNPTAISNACKNVSITGGKFTGGIQEYRDYSVSITGGLFGTEPAENQISGRYRLVENTDEETKKEFPYTISFRDIVSLEIAGEETTYYPTIQEAIDKAGNKEAVITIDEDVSEEISVGSGQNITLKLGRYTLSGNVLINGTLHFDGGFISSDEIAMHVCDGTLIMDSGEINAGVVGIYAENGKITFNGGTINSEAVAVWVNASSINVSGGSISGTVASILSTNGSDVNVSDGEINGKQISADLDDYK